MIESMFHMQLPLLEKVLRPVLVYAALILMLRAFGKRELAQLNPFDLVVLLSLSNTVQNAIIGNDNSLTGGLVGALALLTANWVLSKAMFHAPRLNDALQGKRTVLIQDGIVDQAALRAETLTPEELIGVLHRNNHNRPEDVQICALEPNGTFYVMGKSPSADDERESSLEAKIEALVLEMKLMREEMAARR